MDVTKQHKQSRLSGICLRTHPLLLTVLGLFIFTRILFSFHHHGVENQFEETDARLECGYCLVAHAAVDLDNSVQTIAIPPFASSSYRILLSQTTYSISISAASARAPPHV